MLSNKQLERVQSTLSLFSFDVKKYIIKENLINKKGILTIAKELNVGPDIMKNIVNFYEIIPFHKIIEKNPVNEQDVIFLYSEKEMSISNIAFMMNSGEKEIEKILEKNSIQKRTSIHKEISKEDVLYLYSEKGLQLKDIAKIMNCSNACMTNFCKKNGIEISGGKYDFEYDDLFFLNNEKKLTSSEISKMMNVDRTTIDNWLKKFNLAPNFEPPNISKNENVLGDLISSLYDGPIVRNSREIISPYELDIFIPDKNIAFEFNGIYWHNEINKTNDYHKIKTNLCNDKNIRLIHIWEDDFCFYYERTLNFIKSFFQTPVIVQARKTNASFVSPVIAENLLEKNHIQGSCKFSVSCGLFYENKMISCMTFIKNKDEWILNRYANEYGYSIIGGFQKLLKNFIKKYSPKKIISFADLSWVSPSNNVYTRNGFKKDYEIPIDYKYIYKGKRTHKFNFRHKFLSNKLENYDPNISERKNMINNKIYRIYDSGKIKYSYEY